MKCLDWSQVEPYWIEGRREDGIFQSLDFEFVPCNVLIKGLKDSISEGCIADKEKQLEYLGDYNLVFLANE